MKKITDYLQELGLTEIESLLYQGLLKTGPTTVMDLSENTGIKRITVHFNIENLINKGLVTQSVQGSRRQIKAEPPERLHYFIEQKSQVLQHLKNDYSEIEKTLKKLTPSNIIQSDMDVKYYQGKKQIQRLYDEILKTNQLWSIVNVDKVLETFPENQQKFSRAIDKNLELWEIVDVNVKKHTYIETLNEKHYHNKRVPNNIHIFEMDYMLYENTVALLDYRPIEPAGVVIINPTLFKGLKSIFDLLWNSLP